MLQFLACIISHSFSLLQVSYTTNLQHILHDPNENSEYISPILHYYSVYCNPRYGMNIILYHHHQWQHH